MFSQPNPIAFHLVADQKWTIRIVQAHVLPHQFLIIIGITIYAVMCACVISADVMSQKAAALRTRRLLISRYIQELPTGRLQNLLVDFWGYEGQVDILNSFEGLNVDLGSI